MTTAELTAHAATVTRTITFRDAIREALLEEMQRDASVFIIGECVELRSAWRTTKDLSVLFPGRVRDTPISESAIVGAAVGAAMLGMRPVAEVMIGDFVTTCMDELVNQAGKMRYMFGGQTDLPLVVRIPTGMAKNAAAQHSQTLEAWFMHAPGLLVAVPSTPYDAKGMLKTALRGRDPVLFFEYKMLYAHKGEVPDEDFTVPLGQARIARDGTDATIVTWGAMVHKATAAAEALAAEGRSVEVLDLRTLVPLDTAAILRSVEKTHRVIVADEGYKAASASSEVAALVAEKAFYALDAPVKRVASPNVPKPFATQLELAVLPQTEDLIRAVRDLF
jgi:pyruvate dehydrogenase E1 component beta subunit